VRSDLNLDTSVRICIAIKDKDISAERDKQPFDRLLVSVGFDEDDGSDYDMVDETNERTNEGPGDHPPGCSSDRADEDGAEYLDGDSLEDFYPLIQLDLHLPLTQPPNRFMDRTRFGRGWGFLLQLMNHYGCCAYRTEDNESECSK
jgi:hypothetical protein